MPELITAWADMEGGRELMAALKELGTKAPLLLRPAINKALTPLVKAIKQATPVGPKKNLKKSITRKVFTSKKVKTVVGLAGARRSGSGAKAPHEHLVAFGTTHRYRLGGGQTKEEKAHRRSLADAFGEAGVRANYTGKMPANDYADKIAQRMRPQLEKIIVDEAMWNIEKVTAKLAAKKAKRARLV